MEISVLSTTNYDYNQELEISFINEWCPFLALHLSLFNQECHMDQSVISITPSKFKHSTWSGISTFGRGMTRGSPPVPNTETELNSSYSTCINK